jgi:hypothetical protein
VAVTVVAVGVEPVSADADPADAATPKSAAAMMIIPFLNMVFTSFLLVDGGITLAQFALPLF